MRKEAGKGKPAPVAQPGGKYGKGLTYPRSSPSMESSSPDGSPGASSCITFDECALAIVALGDCDQDSFCHELVFITVAGIRTQ